jgi:hypothetical protein
MWQLEHLGIADAHLRELAGCVCALDTGAAT